MYCTINGCIMEYDDISNSIGKIQDTLYFIKIIDDYKIIILYSGCSDFIELDKYIYNKMCKIYNKESLKLTTECYQEDKFKSIRHLFNNVENEIYSDIVYIESDQKFDIAHLKTIDNDMRKQIYFTNFVYSN